MSIQETIGKHIERARHYTQLRGDLFALGSESFAVLQALGVPQAYNLSLKEQGALVDAFAATLAQAKHGGWFAIDKTLAHLRDDAQEITERYGKETRLTHADNFYQRRANKRRSQLTPERNGAVEAALEAAQFTYNITLRGETTKLTSLHRLRASRRMIRATGAKVGGTLPKAA